LNKERDAGGDSEEKKDEDKPRPNPALEQGAILPAKMGDFPPEMFGLPIEEIDEYYFNKYVSYHQLCDGFNSGFQILR
jgi:voltage-gated sodium channel type IV alpha